ncbi:Hypothetical protein I5071_57610 [Sandaracinus amylolyticus]|nr:Hypothetical protein I5071_57610 [Sandaracinus amylolyticus]
MCRSSRTPARYAEQEGRESGSRNGGSSHPRRGRGWRRAPRVSAALATCAGTEEHRRDDRAVHGVSTHESDPRSGPRAQSDPPAPHVLRTSHGGKQPRLRLSLRQTPCVELRTHHIHEREQQAENRAQSSDLVLEMRDPGRETACVERRGSDRDHRRRASTDPRPPCRRGDVEVADEERLAPFDDRCADAMIVAAAGTGLRRHASIGHPPQRRGEPSCRARPVALATRRRGQVRARSTAMARRTVRGRQRSRTRGGGSRYDVRVCGASRLRTTEGGAPYSTKRPQVVEFRRRHLGWA